MNIVPRHRQVLLRMQVDPETSSGGIALAQSEAERTSRTRGWIVALGPEVNYREKLAAVNPSPTEFKDNLLEVGQYVIVEGDRRGGDMFKMNGSPHVLVEEAEILATITGAQW